MCYTTLLSFLFISNTVMVMTISEVAFNLILENIPMFGTILFIYIVIDIFGWAFLGRRK